MNIIAAVRDTGLQPSLTSNYLLGPPPTVAKHLLGNNLGVPLVNNRRKSHRVQKIEDTLGKVDSLQ